MAEVTQELRDDIERIREDLDSTLDALGDRVSPRRIARRRKDAVRARVARVRTGVMGSASGPRPQGGERGAARAPALGRGQGPPGEGGRTRGGRPRGREGARSARDDRAADAGQSARGGPCRLWCGHVVGDAVPAHRSGATRSQRAPGARRAAQGPCRRSGPRGEGPSAGERTWERTAGEGHRDRSRRRGQGTGPGLCSGRQGTGSVFGGERQGGSRVGKSPAPVGRARSNSPGAPHSSSAGSGGARPVHVVPREGEWVVEREGATRASSRHSTQAGAEERARAVARREGAELVVHGRDGRIRQRDSYGNDPSRSQG